MHPRPALSFRALILFVLVFITACSATPLATPTPIVAPPPARPPATATPMPAPVVVATATAVPTPVLSSIRPNELGRILILEYHVIGDEELRWTRRRDHFRADLERLYRAGYYLASLKSFLDDKIDVPAGKSPVILTFDDSSRGQFQFLPGSTADPKLDPNSGLGILESFVAEHPDFGRGGVFCILPGADPPNDLFGQPELRQAKLRFLAQHGYDLCNHTLWHATLTTLTAKEMVRQVGAVVKAVQEAMPGYQLDIFNPPHGIYPNDLGPIVEGDYEGVHYHNRAMLEVSGGPMTAPDDRRTDLLHISRTQAIQSQLDEWLDYLEKHAEDRYVSDGNPNTVVFPAGLRSRLRLRPGAMELPSPDPAYVTIRLR